MAGNSALGAAKNAKNDEFYTQYSDIEAEMNAYYEYNPDVFRDKVILLPCDDPEWSNFTRYFAANFTRFGLKKLISTSYLRSAGSRHQTLFELSSSLFDEKKHRTRGKLFTLSRDTDGSGHIDTDDIEFSGYLKGDGDFRSEEVTKLRDEADIIITNPPFSLFRDFLAWILEGGKDFIIMGNKNAITYKEVFPLLKDNKMWVGYTSLNGGRWMILPKDIIITSGKARDDGNGNKILNVAGVCWFANLDHGKRHEPLFLDTMEHNLKFHKKLRETFEDKYGAVAYPHYDNFDAIEVPIVECIPSDYDGVMGVPVTFMDKYNPDQFEILDTTERWSESRTKKYSKAEYPTANDLNATWVVITNHGPVKGYKRLLIRRKKGADAQ